MSKSTNLICPMCVEGPFNDDADLERFLLLLDQRALSPLTVKSLVWQFKKLKKEIEDLRAKYTDRELVWRQAELILQYQKEKASLRESLKLAIKAFDILYSDTQHSEHKCVDSECPVEISAEMIRKIKAKDNI